ncbi:MAG: hypothetical protein JSS02_11575 [Planctomycetes bacterium]|nr:hypothetical protein [Planctomycetota bacterium]
MRPQTPAETCRVGIWRLCAVVAVFAIVWLAGLPWLASYPPLAARLDWLADQRVDPSAMYYTEVEALEPVLQRLNARGRRANARAPSPAPQK